MSLRLVLVDDHTVVLEGLRALLSLESDLEVVALCTDGNEAVEAVVKHSPDVLVMDATMPESSGLDAAARLRLAGETVPTIILTATLDDPTLLQCLEIGVEGLVLKESAAAGLVDAIRKVAAGEQSIPPLLSQRALNLLAQRNKVGEDGLTSREREIVLRVAAGDSNKRAAFELGIAEGTVKLHLHNAFRKLDVSNRVQLSLLARERGWI